MSTPYKDPSIEIFLPKPHIQVPNKEEQTKNPCPYIGLYNRGNTCYLNSLMQTLFMTPIFRSEMFNWKYMESIHPSKPDCIPYQLQKLLCRLQLKYRCVEETEKLTKSFQWNNSQLSEQNDIQELCHVLFEVINENFINEIFQGEMTSAIKCLECQKISEHNEKFIDFSLPVKNAKVSIDSLEKSFKILFETEKLTGDNQYFCEKCNKKVDAEHYFVLKHLPKIMICALNRFEYDFVFDTKKKVNNKLEFPFSIDINTIFSSTNRSLDTTEPTKDKYDLYSIIVHSGSARGGHYYSIIKSFEDNKWYKFDDSVVYEVNIDELLEQLYGNAQSDTSAYILLYSNCNNEKYSYEIGNELIREIQAEEVEYKKAIEEEKERMSYMNIKVSYDNKIDFVKIKKYEKICTLKTKIIEVFNLTDINVNNTRIRVMNSNHSKIIDVLSNEDLSLEEANVNGNKIYDLEIKKENEEFSPFNPNDIYVNVIIWDDILLTSKDIFKEIDSIGKKMLIDKKISNTDFISKVIDTFFSNEKEISVQLLIMKKQDYGVNNFNLIELTKDINDFFSEDMKIYIEKNTSFKDSKFNKLFEAQIENVKVFFNLPLDTSKIKRITVKSYTFDNCIEIHPKKTITDLKNSISQIINVPIDNFIMKKNSHNGVEIKKYNETVDKYSSKTLTIYIQYGTPVKLTDMKIVIQQYIPEKEQFSLYPYKINDLGITTINKTWTVKQLLENIEKTNKKFTKINDEKMEYKLFLRKENNFKPGKFYDENEIIEKSDIKENSTVIIQYVNVSSIFNFIGDKKVNQKNIIQFFLRIWDHSKWEMPEPIEIILDKSTPIEDFSKIFLSKIFEEKKFESMSLNDLYGTKINQNEIYFYLDDIEKKEFYSFVDFYQSLLENFPFMINNDSCMLLIKDISKPYREPTAEEKEFYYKKTDKKKPKTVKKKTPTIPVKSNFKKERYKEKAMVITVKQKDSTKTEIKTPDSVLTNSTSNSNNDYLDNCERKELFIKENSNLNINL